MNAHETTRQIEVIANFDRTTQGNLAFATFLPFQRIASSTIGGQPPHAMLDETQRLAVALLAVWRPLCARMGDTLVT